METAFSRWLKSLAPDSRAVLQRWLNHLTVQNKSPRTCEGYAWEIRGLHLAMPRLDFGSYVADDLLDYLAQRRRAGHSDTTIRRAVSAFRVFFKYIGRAEVAKAIPFPRIKRKKQRYLNSAQLLAILATCESTTPEGVRRDAMLKVMVDTGLRAGEVCRLALNNVDVAARTLDVVVKGGDSKTKHFSAYTAESLARWLSIRPNYARVKTCDKATGKEMINLAVFVGLGGLTPGEPLTPGGLRAIFRKIGEDAGLGQPLSPHDLRRSMAHLATRLGAPARVVQAQGGWSNIKMLEAYTQDISAADFRPYSPVAAILGG